MEHPAYPSELTDTERRMIEPVLPLSPQQGRPREYAGRAILNASFSVLRTGGQGRAVPQDWPPWATVSPYWGGWRKAGLWEQLHPRLRAHVRVALGREAQPSAGVIDSQSVKTTGGEESGARTEPRR